MDLLDFEGQSLYFDEPMPEKVKTLLDEAAEAYGKTDSELLLLEAHLMAPENLTVLVALYRYYYYQHRLEHALIVSDRALRASGKLLEFPETWDALDIRYLAYGAMKSMGLVRFYLLCLKAAGYLNLRLRNNDEGLAMLNKVVELDESDRLGARLLIEVFNANLSGTEDHQRIAV